MDSVVRVGKIEAIENAMCIIKEAKKYTKDQMDRYYKTTSEWEKRNKPIFKNAPKRHKFAPLSGGVAGAASGGGATYAIGRAISKKRPALGGAIKALSGIGAIAGGVAGGLGGMKAIKNTKYKKDLSASNKVYFDKVKKIENE